MSYRTPPQPIEPRFWPRVDRRGQDECWLWIGASVNRKGYPQFTVNGWPVCATHVALELAGFPRPEGGHALHSCDIPRCVNPSHLRWGSNAENVRDRTERGRGSGGRQLGESNPRSKLDAAKVRYIRESGKTAASLGRELGVTLQCISNVLHGKTWVSALEAGRGTETGK